MVTVKRDGKRWGVYVNGQLIEGGFFARDAATRAAHEYSNGDCAGIGYCARCAQLKSRPGEQVTPMPLTPTRTERTNG